MARSGFVYVENARLMLDGSSFRHVAMGITGLAYYGAGLTEWTRAEHQVINLDAAASAGASAIRVFSPRNLPVQQNVALCVALADAALGKGIRLIISLTDLFEDKGYGPPGDGEYRITSPSGFRIYSHKWYAGGWPKFYLPWLKAVVGALKDHPGVLAWELGNELKDEENPDQLIAFMHDAAAELRAIDPDHLICSGNNATASLVAHRAADFYAPVDIVATHHHGADDKAYHDKDLATSLGKAHLVTEFGVKAPCKQGGRSDSLTSALAYWYDTVHTDGVYQWGFQGQRDDIGDGDREDGVDHFCHTDYDAMVAVYAARAAALGRRSLPPERVTLCGKSLVWSEVDAALRGIGWPGPFDRGAAESAGYTNAFCPTSGKVAYSYSVESIGTQSSVRALEVRPAYFPPGQITLPQGGTAILFVGVQNTGTETWLRDGPAPVRLGTSGPRDREGRFHAGQRIALPVAAVPPGEVVIFRIPVSVPGPWPPGVYQERYELVAEGRQWIPGEPIGWQITVVPSGGGAGGLENLAAIGIAAGIVGAVAYAAAHALHQGGRS